jgi:hypothetical protein
MHIRGEELDCHLFLTSALYSGEWSLHTLAAFWPGCLYNKLSGPWSQSGCFWAAKSLTPAGIRTTEFLVHSPITTATILFFIQPNVFTYQRSWLVKLDVRGSLHYSTTHKEKSNKMQQCIKIFITPYLYEAQHVSCDTLPIIRSLKLYWQPLVFHMWKVVGRVVGGHC